MHHSSLLKLLTCWLLIALNKSLKQWSRDLSLKCYFLISCGSTYLIRYNLKEVTYTFPTTEIYKMENCCTRKGGRLVPINLMRNGFICNNQLIRVGQCLVSNQSSIGGNKGKWVLNYLITTPGVHLNLFHIFICKNFNSHKCYTLCYYLYIRSKAKQCPLDINFRRP